MDSVMHVKVRHANELRRFQCKPVFEVLESFLRLAFALDTDPFTIHYLDDEDELCRISSQLELDYAITLPPTGAPLKLVVTTKPSSIPSVVPLVPLTSPIQPAQPAQPPSVPKQVAVLTERLALIASALEQPNLPPQRRKNLESRQEVLSAKLKLLEKTPPSGKLANSSDSSNKGQNVVNDANVQAVQKPGPWKTKLATINAALLDPNLPPIKRQLLTKRKEVIEAKMNQSANPTLPGTHLQSRLAVVTSALENPDLSPASRQNLAKRKAILEGKLASMPPSIHGAFSGATGPSGPVHPPGPQFFFGPHHPGFARHHGQDFRPGFTGGATKVERLETHLLAINASLEQPNLPAQTVERLNKKKEFIQWKLSAIRDTQQNDSSQKDFKIQSLQRRLDQIVSALEQPDLPPTRVQHLNQKKAWIQAKLDQHASGTPDGKPFQEMCGQRWQMKLARINSALQQPNLTPVQVQHLNRRKEWIESKMANRGCKGAANPRREELLALRNAVGSAKVALNNAKRSGIRGEELIPYVDALLKTKDNLRDFKNSAPAKA